MSAIVHALLASTAASRAKGAGGVAYPETLVNPGAELGNATGWTSRYGGLPLVLQGGAATGAYYFAAGNNGLGRWDQQLAIPVATRAAVDAGRVEATINVKRAGWTDADKSGLYLQFFDANARVIGAKFQPRTDPGNSATPVWVNDSFKTWVPPGTRSYRVGVWHERVSGTESSTYFDDFSVTLTTNTLTSIRPLLWLYPYPEDVAATTPGTANALHQGEAENYLRFPGLGATATGVWHIQKTLPTDLIGEIDSGRADYEWFFLAGNYPHPNGLDQFRAQLQFYDESGTAIPHAAIETGAAPTAPPTSWMNYTFSGKIPAGSRTVRVIYTAAGSSGAARDAYISHMTLLIGITQAKVGVVSKYAVFKLADNVVGQINKYSIFKEI